MADKRTDAEILAKKESFLVPFYPTEIYLDSFTDEQAGKLFKMCFRYERTREDQETSDVELKMAFRTFKKYSDDRRSEYLIKSRKNSESVQARWDKRKSE